MSQLKYIFAFFFIFTPFIFGVEPAFLKEREITSRGNISLTPMILEQIVDSTYILGPGDFFDLTLENKYFSVQVSPDGTIAIDECGVILVGNKTFAEAKAEILKAISERYNPKYSYVQLSKLKSIKVMLMGAVPNTGQVVLDPQTRLSTAIRAYGGFLANADKEHILVIRGNDTLVIDYDLITKTGDFTKDVVVLQGDKIFIPYLEAKDAVTLVLPSRSVTVPYKESRTISEYYLNATGDNIENGAFKSVKIKDIHGKDTRISMPETRTFKPLPGSEILCIGESGTNEFVYVGGAVAVMGKVPYNPDFKALDYIAASGVTPITGSWDQVRVVRGDRETLDLNPTNDVILPGDYIEIPKSTYENFKDFTMFLASLLTVISSTFIIYMNYK